MTSAWIELVGKMINEQKMLTVTVMNGIYDTGITELYIKKKQRLFHEDGIILL